MYTLTAEQANAIREAQGILDSIIKPMRYEDEAKQIIRDVIASRPEFDINELLYNSDDVADFVDDYIFNELSEQWESDYIKQVAHDPDGARIREFVARERMMNESALVAHVMGEVTLSYEWFCEAFECSEWVEVECAVLRYLASDLTTIREVIDELTTESLMLSLNGSTEAEGATL